MEFFGLLCVASYCGMAFLVAVRLLRLAAQTGELPELLIGLSLLVGGAIGYPGTVAASLAAGPSPDLASRLAIGGILGLFLSAWSMLLCWYAIYHRGRLWARNTVVLGSALLFLFLVERLAGVDPAALAASRREPSLSYLGWLLVGALPYALNAVSGLRYHAMLSRRIPLGLADPVVANRILLWSLTSLSVVVQYAYSLSAVLLGSGLAAASTAVVGSLGLSIAVLLALAFFPPGSFMRWVQARAEA